MIRAVCELVLQPISLQAQRLLNYETSERPDIR